MNVAIFSGAGIDIVLDLIVLLLPIPKLLQLEVSKAEKVGILANFSVGSFAIVCSCVRLKYIGLLGTSTNITKDYVTVVVWSVVEGGATFLCANMPPMAAMLRTVYDASIVKMTSLYSSRKYASEKSGNSHAVGLSKGSQPRN